MRSFRLFSLVAWATVLASTALCADVTGKWSGKVVVEGDAKIMQGFGQQANNAPKANIELRANKTYTATQTSNGKTVKSEGTWTVSGNKVTMTPKTRDGKPVAGEQAKPRVFVVSADGKSMVCDLTGMVRAQASAMTKSDSKEGKEAAKSLATMKVKIVMKRG